MDAGTPASDRSPRRGAALWLLGLVVTLVLAAVVSGFASSEPDGLEKVAEEQQILDAAREHDLAGSALADYRVDGVDDDRLSRAAAGAVGVAATLAVGAGLFWLARRRRAEPPAAGAPGGDSWAGRAR